MLLTVGFIPVFMVLIYASFFAGKPEYIDDDDDNYVEMEDLKDKKTKRTFRSTKKKYKAHKIHKVSKKTEKPVLPLQPNTYGIAIGSERNLGISLAPTKDRHTVRTMYKGNDKKITPLSRENIDIDDIMSVYKDEDNGTSSSHIMSPPVFIERDETPENESNNPSDDNDQNNKDEIIILS